MCRLMKVITFVLLCTLCTGVNAQYLAPPPNGFFWNPAEPGKGWAVESQDNLIFIATYTFQPTGTQSVFYTTIGTWDGFNRRVTGDLLEFTGGPCLNCGPATSTPRNLGTITFEFPTRDSGTAVFQGRRTPMVRFLYKYAPTANSLMLGIWHTTLGASGVYFGDFLRNIGSCATASSCAGLIDPFYGYRIDAGSLRILLGSRNPNDPNEIVFILDSSTSYYELYRIRPSLNVYAGTSNIYLKGTNPTGNGLPVFGSRLFGGPNEAAVAFGPSTIAPPPSKVHAAALDAQERERAMLSASSTSPGMNPFDGKANPAGDVPELRAQLERALEELRRERF